MKWVIKKIRFFHRLLQFISHHRSLLYSIFYFFQIICCLICQPAFSLDSSFYMILHFIILVIQLHCYQISYLHLQLQCRIFQKIHENLDVKDYQSIGIAMQWSDQCTCLPITIFETFKSSPFWIQFLLHF